MAQIAPETHDESEMTQQVAPEEQEKPSPAQYSTLYKVMPKPVAKYAKKSRSKACIVFSACFCICILVLGAVAVGIVVPAWLKCEGASITKNILIGNGTIPIGSIDGITIKTDQLYRHDITFTTPVATIVGGGLVTSEGVSVDAAVFSTMSTTITPGSTNMIVSKSTETMQDFFSCRRVRTKLLIGDSNPMLNVTISGTSPRHVFFNNTDLLTFKFGTIHHRGTTGWFRTAGLAANLLDVRLSTGSVTIDGRFGHVSAHTETGSITLKNIVTDKSIGPGILDLKTETGSITMTDITSVDSLITAVADTGRVSVQVPDNFKGSYTLTTDVGSSTLSGATLSTPTTSTSGSKTVKTGTIGGGGSGSVTLTTDTGDITLSQPTK